MSQPKAAPTPPVASPSWMMLNSPVKENPNEREILGTMERNSLDMLPASQAASISYAGDKIITHRLLDIKASQDHDEFMDELREEVGYDPELGIIDYRRHKNAPPNKGSITTATLRPPSLWELNCQSSNKELTWVSPHCFEQALKS